MRAALASRNEHKLRELSALLPGWELEALAAADYPEEAGETFYENARAKARLGRRHAAPGIWALGEDSGLEVDALGGRPGLHSARYAGPGASDEENVAKLLRELAGAEADERRARYVCELVCLTSSHRELRATGTLAGVIAESPRGAEGFGYDPVFVPGGESRTVAELGDGWKTEHSHRAQAARLLLEVVGASVQEL